MTYQVEIAPAAKLQIKKLAQPIQKLIIERQKINSISVNNRTNDIPLLGVVLHSPFR